MEERIVPLQTTNGKSETLMLLHIKKPSVNKNVVFCRQKFQPSPSLGRLVSLLNKTAITVRKLAIQCGLQASLLIINCMFSILGPSLQLYFAASVDPGLRWNTGDIMQI